MHVSFGTPFNLSMLNQHECIEKSQKWLNSLPNPLFRGEVFWRQVYEGVIKLAEILEQRGSDQNSIL